jgi:hypothetical protein
MKSISSAANNGIFLSVLHPPSVEVGIHNPLLKVCRNWSMRNYLLLDRISERLFCKQLHADSANSWFIFHFALRVSHLTHSGNNKLRVDSEAVRRHLSNSYCPVMTTISKNV